MEKPEKTLFKKLISSGKVKAHLEGPKDNVLVCDTINDWAIAGAELVAAGYDICSPGGYGGSHPESRQATHQKVWENGTLCASVINKKIFVFKLRQTVNDHCDIVYKKRA